MSLSLAVVVVLLSVLSVAFGEHDSESGRFSWGSSESKTSSSSSSSSDSSSSTSDSLSSDQLRAARLERDQRRIELAVQAALLKDKVEPALPARASFNSKSYQFSLTTLRDRYPADSVGLNQSNPTFGPAAVFAYTNPPDGLFGPARTRAVAQRLDTFDLNFGTLFSEVRRAGFLGEFDLRTLVQADGTFTLRSRPLVTPCFPVTDEPGLTIEFVALARGINGSLRRKWLAADRFFDNDHQFLLDGFVEELPLSRFDATNNRFDTTTENVAVLTATPCNQFSYFS